MTSRAVTASSVHATLEDLGYKTCLKHTEPYRWMGGSCPRCSALKNPNLIPRSRVREMPKPIRKNNASQKRGGQATGSKKKGMLTDEQVIALRKRYWVKGETLTPLAKELKTTPTTIHHAVNGLLAYAHIEYMPDKTKRPSREKRTHAKRLTPEEVRAIRGRNASGASYDVLAREYDRTKGTIENICKRRIWKNI